MTYLSSERIRKSRNSFIVMKLVRGMNIVLTDMKTKLTIIMVSCFPDRVSWSWRAATKSTSKGMIRELKITRIIGAKYSGRKFLKTMDLLRMSSSSH